MLHESTIVVYTDFLILTKLIDLKKKTNKQEASQHNLILYMYKLI